MKKKSEKWNHVRKLALACILAASVFSQHAVAKSVDPAPLIKTGRQNLAKQTSDPKFGSWELKTGVEVACGMVDGLKIPA